MFERAGALRLGAPFLRNPPGRSIIEKARRVWEIGKKRRDTWLQVFKRCTRECVTGAARSPDFFIIVSHRKRLLSAWGG